jgi:hypothetical protein
MGDHLFSVDCAGLSLLLARVVTRRDDAIASWRNWTGCAAIAVLVLVGLSLRGADSGNLLGVIILTSVAALLVMVRQDATWLIVGWISGHLALPHLAAATKVPMGNPGLIAGAIFVAVMTGWVSTVVRGRWSRT